MKKILALASKLVNGSANVADGLTRYAGEQVNTNKEYLNINGYVMAVRLPY